MNPGSSPEAATLEGDPVDTVQPDASSSAPSSSAATQGGDTFLDSVNEALKGSETEQSPGSETVTAETAANPKPKGEAQADPAKAAESPLGEITEEELNRYGPKTQRRIKQLLAERSAANEEVAKLKPKAENFDKIDAFVRQNNLSNEDLAVIFELGALIKNDPVKAFERLKPINDRLAEIVGEVLPPDIQERVRLGYISQDDAKELVRARKRAELADANAQRREQINDQERQQQAFLERVSMCRSTANEWEAARKGTDPAWNDKAARIGELIELECYRKGYPETKEGVTRMLDGLLEKVNAEFSRFKPKPREVRPVIGAAPTRATAEPKSFQEAVDMALAQ
jgi:hypothetical protein